MSVHFFVWFSFFFTEYVTEKYFGSIIPLKKIKLHGKSLKSHNKLLISTLLPKLKFQTANFNFKPFCCHPEKFTTLGKYHWKYSRNRCLSYSREYWKDSKNIDMENLNVYSVSYLSPSLSFIFNTFWNLDAVKKQFRI